MSLIRRLLKALHDAQVRRHKRWLIKNRILMPKPRADERNWSGAYMESLKQ